MLIVKMKMLLIVPVLLILGCEKLAPSSDLPSDVVEKQGKFLGEKYIPRPTDYLGRALQSSSSWELIFSCQNDVFRLQGSKAIEARDRFRGGQEVWLYFLKQPPEREKQGYKEEFLTVSDGRLTFAELEKYYESAKSRHNPPAIVPCSQSEIAYYFFLKYGPVDLSKPSDPDPNHIYVPDGAKTGPPGLSRDEWARQKGIENMLKRQGD